MIIFSVYFYICDWAETEIAFWGGISFFLEQCDTISNEEHR